MEAENDQLLILDKHTNYIESISNIDSKKWLEAMRFDKWMSKLYSEMGTFKKMSSWHNLKVSNLRNLPINYASYKNSFINLSKLQGVEIFILMR